VKLFTYTKNAPATTLLQAVGQSGLNTQLSSLVKVFRSDYLGD